MEHYQNVHVKRVAQEIINLLAGLTDKEWCFANFEELPETKKIAISILQFLGIVQEQAYLKVFFEYCESTGAPGSQQVDPSWKVYQAILHYTVGARYVYQDLLEDCLDGYLGVVERRIGASSTRHKHVELCKCSSFRLSTSEQAFENIHMILKHWRHSSESEYFGLVEEWIAANNYFDQLANLLHPERCNKWCDGLFHPVQHFFSSSFRDVSYKFQTEVNGTIDIYQTEPDPIFTQENDTSGLWDQFGTQEDTSQKMAPAGESHAETKTEVNNSGTPPCSDNDLEEVKKQKRVQRDTEPDSKKNVDIRSDALACLVTKLNLKKPGQTQIQIAREVAAVFGKNAENLLRQARRVRDQWGNHTPKGQSISVRFDPDTRADLST